MDISFRKMDAAIADHLLPELEAGEFAFIIGMPVGPIEFLKAIQRKAGEADQFGMGCGILWSGENHSVVKDNCAQSQSESPVFASVYGGKEAFSYCA